MLESLRLKLKQPRVFFTLFAMIVAIPMVYQNCSEPPLESYDLKSVADTAPFAFEEKIDQIAYMSCSDMGSPTSYDRGAFFTFKAGMYNRGSGFRLNESYMHATRNLSFVDRVAALDDSSANGKVFMAMGVRPVSAMQTVFQIDSFYAAKFIGSLSQNGVASPLVQNSGTSFLKDFDGVTTTTNISDSIHLGYNEAAAVQVRSELASGNGVLAITYNKTGADAAQALAPSKGSATNVYGHGYKIKFKKGFDMNGTYNNGLDRVIASVKEKNLATGVDESAIWDCDPKWVFIIVKDQKQLGDTIQCNKYNPTVEPTPTNAVVIKALAMLRSMLPKENWGVDLQNRCIIPRKAGNCYGTATKPINYFGSNNPKCPNASSCSPPHYVSICKRR